MNKKMLFTLTVTILLFISSSFIVNAKKTSITKNYTTIYSKNIDIEKLDHQFLSYTGNKLFVGGSGTGNYSKIQDAINNSQKGDTIFVYNGTYQENLEISKTIKLSGENRDNTIINGIGKTNTIHILIDSVTISNFTINNSGTFDAGVKINSNNNVVENCNIINCWDGIELSQSEKNIISNCCIAYNKWSGLYSFKSSENIIDNCIVQNNLDGLLMVESSSNIIQNSDIKLNIQEGIELERFSTKNIVNKCRIKNNGGVGLFVYWASDNSYISFCEIKENLVGIEIGSVFLGGGNYTSILSNNIVNNTDSGILFLGNGIFSKETHIHFNNIYNNGEGISAQSASSFKINAQNNWWGSKYGPSILGLGKREIIKFNPMNSRIRFFPWLKTQEKNILSEEPETNSNVYCHSANKKVNTFNPNILPIYYWSGKTIYVGGNGPNNYTTIQNAIDNANEGDTIYIYNGIYQENINIHQRIKLLGEEKQKVIIDGKNKTDTIYFQKDGIIITNLTIINSGNFDAGIKINTRYNNIHNCDIQNCWDGIELNYVDNNKITKCNIAKNKNEGVYLYFSFYNDFEDCQIPHNLESIWLDSSDHNTFVNCLICDNKEEGIQMKDSSYNSFISSEITSNILGYGFYIQSDSDGNKINNCKITGNGVGLFFSASRKNTGPSKNVISFCNISNNLGTAIFFLGNGSQMNDTHIHYNDIVGNKKGILTVNSNNCYISAQNNWWGSKSGPNIFGLKGRMNRVIWIPSNGKIYLYPWLKSPV